MYAGTYFAKTRLFLFFVLVYCAPKVTNSAKVFSPAEPPVVRYLMSGSPVEA